MRVGKPEYEAETRSPEIALLPAVTEASPHHVDHVSASVVRPLESLRMANQAFGSKFFHEVHKPLHGSSGFDAHAHRSGKR